MGRQKPPDRAVGLFGGGLDSVLAFRSMQDAGATVEGVFLDTGFVRETHQRHAQAATGVETIDVRQRYLEEVVAAPRHGYGSGMNPCHDCRAFMLARADEWAASRGVEQLFTGDVIGQRAHDQSHEAFRVADRESGTAGRVLRPLCGAHLDPVEVLGPALLLQGRSRREQLRLAREWDVGTFPTPSGRCCRLADPAFARRVRDYLEHRPRETLRAADIPLLGHGRHFRLGWDLKVILSRNEAEAGRLAQLGVALGTCEPLETPGPQGWIEGTCPDAGSARDIGALVARYTPGARPDGVDVRIRLGSTERVVRAAPVDDEVLARWRV
jgi:tRNA-specific 2-thiouridylase